MAKKKRIFELKKIKIKTEMKSKLLYDDLYQLKEVEVIILLKIFNHRGVSESICIPFPFSMFMYRYVFYLIDFK